MDQALVRLDDAQVRMGGQARAGTHPRHRDDLRRIRLGTGSCMPEPLRCGPTPASRPGLSRKSTHPCAFSGIRKGISPATNSSTAPSRSACLGSGTPLCARLDLRHQRHHRAHARRARARHDSDITEPAEGLMTPDEHMESLLTTEADGGELRFMFFWGHRPRPDGLPGPGCLSQWWPAAFTVD